MSDLISRSASIDTLLAENQKCITSTGHELTMNMVVSFINAQPIAYDKEAVVKQLQEQSDYEPIDYDYSDTACSDEQHFIATDKAIELVKAGGIDKQPITCKDCRQYPCRNTNEALETCDEFEWW